MIPGTHIDAVVTLLCTHVGTSAIFVGPMT